MGLDPLVRPVAVDETPRSGESTEQTALRLASDKASAAARESGSHPILAADTIVAIGGRQLGKPANREQAVGMLRQLSGRWHEVITGIALRTSDGAVHTAIARTRVRFAVLADEEIERYADSEEPYDKAGGYALQGAASWFVENIAGSSSNVVGLPLEQVRRLLAAAGLPLPSLRATHGAAPGTTVPGDEPI